MGKPQKLKALFLFSFLYFSGFFLLLLACFGQQQPSAADWLLGCGIYDCIFLLRKRDRGSLNISMVKDIYLFGKKWMPLAKVFLSSVVSKAKVALCPDACTHCHRADLLIDILCGWAMGSARRGGAGSTAYRFRGESLGIKKVLHSDRFYALLLLESLCNFPNCCQKKLR